MRAPRPGPVAMLAVLLGLAIAGCVMARTCPCGQTFERDPFDPDVALDLGADHAEEDHCYCRCGGGPELRMPPSRTCRAYEGPCETPAGAPARLACE